jgi:hypothetical protein
MEHKIELRFQGVDDVEATRFANELRSDLLDNLPVTSAEVVKDRSDTMDFGATLVLVLGTPVALVLGKAVANYFGRNSGARIHITADGQVIAENLDSKDAAKVAEVFAERFKTK